MRTFPTFLLAALLARVAAADDGTTRAQVDLGANGGYGGSLHGPAVLVDAGSSASSSLWYRSGTVGGAVGGTFFFRPLRDDAAPPTLQPFLQRASHAWLRATGGATFEAARSPDSVTRRFDGAAGIEIYVAPALLLFADAGGGYRLFTVEGLTTREPRAYDLAFGGGAGVRAGDVLVGVRYFNRVEWATGWAGGGADERAPIGWGGIRVFAQAVVGRRFDVEGFAGAFDDSGQLGLDDGSPGDWRPRRAMWPARSYHGHVVGGGAGVAGTWYVRRNTGPFAGLEWQYRPSHYDEHVVRAYVGVAHWLTRRVGLVGAVFLDWAALPGFPSTTANGPLFDFLYAAGAVELRVRL